MSTIPFGIRSVKIENFRCIDKLELDFTDPAGNPNDIVVIAGPNGCGKTAVLEACLLAMSGESEVKGTVGAASVGNGGNSSLIQAELDIDLRYFGKLFAPEVAEYSSVSGQKWLLENTECADSGTNQIPFHYFSSWRSSKLVGSLSISSGRAGRLPKQTEEYRLRTIKQRLINSKAIRKSTL
jgi:predicted ATP-dependent endonuclease of OLD family